MSNLSRRVDPAEDGRPVRARDDLAAPAGGNADMANLTRRLVLRTSLALGAAGAFARPYVAKAAATTATVWWTQGYAEEEDISFKKIVAEYEKATGNTLDYSIVPYAPLRQKIVSAVTSGVVPDVFPNQPAETIALLAWNDKLVDLTDVVETQREEYTGTALLTALCYNNVEKKRSFYGAPYTQGALPNHVWRSLVEKAGYNMEDIPKTWDAYYDFFKEVQKKLRAQGQRHIYGLGLNLGIGGDPHNVFAYFLIAYGGLDIVTKDGKLHLDDPKVKEAAIRALTYPTTAYKEGFIPPGAINWNDADDNNAIHSKTVVMDLDGSISTEVAIIKNQQEYNDIVTMGLALSNDGKPVPSLTGSFCGLIPKGAKNVAAAKEFLKYLIQPKIINDLLKTGLGRNLPPMLSVVKNDPWWRDPTDPHRGLYVQQGLLGPTVPNFWVYNPAYAQVQSERVFPNAWIAIMKDGLTRQAAADQAFKRVEEIFAKYPIAQG
jgi:multiple sugar transport system substrate-binding protein